MNENLGFIFGIIIGSIILILILFIWIYYFLKINNKKRLIKKLGIKAENIINNKIKIWAKGTKNKIIPSTIFCYEENKVFEVDSIIITSEVLIIVEIKNIKGIIIGESDKEFWIKETANNNFHISNPIIQNEKHISHIIKMLKIKVPILSLIVFTDKATSVEVSNKPKHIVLIKENELFATLDHISGSLPKSFSKEAKNNLYKKILSFKANKKEIQLHNNIVRRK